METSPLTTGEITTATIPVESSEATMDRLRFTPEPAEIGPSEDYIYQVAYKDEENHTVWTPQFDQPTGDGSFIKIDGDDNTTEKLRTEATVASKNNDFLKNKLGKWYRWWDTDTNDFKEDTEQRLSEVIILSDGERSMQLLNLSGENVSEEELEEVKDTFQAVVNFTGGKIFDRVKGITLRKSDRFPGESGGNYWKAANIASVNIEASRDVQHELNDRYKPYFDDEKLPNRLAVILAHELGHGMDIDLYKDHDIDSVIPGDESHFANKFFWRGLRDVETADHEWYENTECREAPPTPYGFTDPAEDFAETFALLSLGVDRSRLPHRAKAMADAVYEAAGSAQHGPFLISAERQQELKAPVPENVYVVPYVKQAA